MAKPIGVEYRLHANLKLKWNSITKDLCWLWTGQLSKDGYGKIQLRPADLWMAGKIGDKPQGCRVHRVAYTIWRGPIPEGMTLDHRCRVITCFNPDHLRPMTTQENVMIGEGIFAQNARKEYCTNGHLLSEENLYTHRIDGRVCKICREIDWRKDYAYQQTLKARCEYCGKEMLQRNIKRHLRRDCRLLPDPNSF